jgi:hypothetical protein
MKQPTQERGSEPHIMFNVSEKVGNVCHFDDGPHPDREYFLGDIVEHHRDRLPDGRIDPASDCYGIGAIVAPSDEENRLPHDKGDLFVDWWIGGKRWTNWRSIGPRF